jgi:hypothetical protein
VKKKFIVHITGTVESNPDFKGSVPDQMEEMREAVENSFKPDEQWGVKVESTDIVVLSKEVL